MTALSNLTPTEAAAVFVMLLEDAEAADLLGRLQPGELERVGSSMYDLGEVDPGRIAGAIAAFVEEAERESLFAEGRETHVRSLLTQAIGEVRTDSMMQRIAPESRPRTVELARWLAPGVLLDLLDGEHPQVIAVLLLMLDAEPAAQVLAQLPEPVQPRVVERIAKLGPVSANAVGMLDELLSQKIGERFGASALTMGGPRDAANLINLASGAMGQRVLPEIEERDAELAKAIEAEMFTFEMLYALEPQPMGRLLRDVDNTVLVDALKGLPEEESAPFFASMSSRAADGVRDEIEMRGKIRRAEVLAAQKTIIDVARRLADEGEIILGASDGEFV